MAIPRCKVKWRRSGLRGSKSIWIHNNLTTTILSAWVSKVIMPLCGQKGKHDEIIWCGYRKYIFPPQSGWMTVQKYCNVWKAPASRSDGNQCLAIFAYENSLGCSAIPAHKSFQSRQAYVLAFGTNFLAHSPRYLLTQLSTISHLRHS